MKRDANFLLPDSGIYLLSHSVGCLPRATRDRLEKTYLAPWSAKGGDAWPDWLAAIDGFKGALAGLLGGRAQDYCPKPNLSAALFSLISALPFDPARPVLLASSQMFPSLGFVAAQCARFGYRLELLPPAADPADPAVWERAMGKDVAAVIAMHVHSNSGVVSPVEDICAMAQQRGIFSIVDIAQSAGILPVDVGQWGAGAVIGSCVKWLCGGPGAGFLWVDPAQIERLAPLDVGWFSHIDPFAFDIEDFHYAGDARRFWGGTPSVAPYVTATAGIETIAAIGVPAILEHNRRLMARVVAHMPAGRIGGTLCLRFPDASAKAERLAAAGCRFDRRGDTLRLSFHIYNDPSDAETVADCLR